MTVLPSNSLKLWWSSQRHQLAFGVVLNAKVQKYKGIGKEVGRREKPTWIIAHLYIYTTSL